MLDAILESILSRIPGLRIAVVGDLFLDRYLDIDARLTEPSIETGLDAYQVRRVRSYPGAAGTVINNLAALGVGAIVPVAVIGDDGEGYELGQALGRLGVVETSQIIHDGSRRTPTYTKPMLEEPGKPARELNRLDIKNRQPTPAKTRRQTHRGDQESRSRCRCTADFGSGFRRRLWRRHGKNSQRIERARQLDDPNCSCWPIVGNDWGSSERRAQAQRG